MDQEFTRGLKVEMEESIYGRTKTVYVNNGLLYHGVTRGMPRMDYGIHVHDQNRMLIRYANGIRTFVSELAICCSPDDKFNELFPDDSCIHARGFIEDNDVYRIEWIGVISSPRIAYGGNHVVYSPSKTPDIQQWMVSLLNAKSMDTFAIANEEDEFKYWPRRFYNGASMTYKFLV